VAAILAAMMAAYKKDEGGGTPSITSFVKIWKWLKNFPTFQQAAS
jgi:hypothetical protein